MALLELREIKKSFGKTIALDSLDFELRRGEVHALIGENGAGKSTLMNIIAGGIRQDSGSMTLAGSPYEPADPQDARGRGIALIHQELTIIPHLTVAENILLGVENSRFGWLGRRDINRRAEEVLSNFDHSEIHPESKAGELPPASLQVVEICRALAAGSEIVLMDEPTSSLQRQDVTRLFELVRSLTNRGITIVYISHFLEEVREVASSFTVIRDGKHVATGEIAEVTDRFLISKMVGRPVENLFPVRRESMAASRPILQVTDLSAPPNLVSASLELYRGQVFGIAGLDGAGRTEFIRALFGLEKCQKGELRIDGKLSPARNSQPSHRVSQGMGYMSDDRKSEGLALKMSVADNMTLTRFSSCSQYGWLNLEKQQTQARQLTAHVGIRALTVSQPVASLSGGNQQKVAVARLIHQEADILLLNEPTRGIDIGSKARIYELIAEMADQGKAILMVSSYLPELFGMCDRLAVMIRGRLSAARPIGEWTPELVLQTAIGSSNESSPA